MAGVTVPPFVCCRWSCWRCCHGAVLSWQSSWTCWLSASLPPPCSAATGALGPRKCPSLCVGRVKPLSALVSPCRPMQVLAMLHPRMWCTTAGRLGMTALPSDTSTRGCGFPVKRAWKGQVASCPARHSFFPWFYSTGVWKWKAEADNAWEKSRLHFPRWHQPCTLSLYFCPSLRCLWWWQETMSVSGVPFCLE